MSFYTDILGMKVTDFVSMGTTKMGFLHCNPRHHSLAFAEVANPRKRINHFMLQLESIDAVGRTYDAVQEGAAPLYVTMGRHSNDLMVSSYIKTPSGFDIEYGWDGWQVDWSDYVPTKSEIFSLWGHPEMSGG